MYLHTHIYIYIYIYIFLVSFLLTETNLFAIRNSDFHISAVGCADRIFFIFIEKEHYKTCTQISAT